MALPGIDISFTNGALEQVVPSPDGCSIVFTQMSENDLLPTATQTLLFARPNLVRSMEMVTAFGISNNAPHERMYRYCQEFFSSGTGLELYIVPIQRTVIVGSDELPNTLVSVFDQSAGICIVESCLNELAGKPRLASFLFNNDVTDLTAVIEDGLLDDVTDVAQAANTFFVNYTMSHYAPVIALIDGFYFWGDASELEDYSTGAMERAGILIGGTGSGDDGGSSLGLLAGRLAKSQVHINPGKVMEGPITLDNISIGDVSLADADITTIHDKGYISFRKWTNKTGVYITDDPLLIEVGNDYRQITHRRTIDKAFRIAYDTLVDYALADFDLLPNGALSPIDAKTIEGRLESAINLNMTVNGELSTDKSNPSDMGVRCKINTTWNMASTSKIKLDYLQVRPKGHARWFDVPLGFVPVNSNS